MFRGQCRRRRDAQLGPRLVENSPGSLEGKARHDRGYYHVGPASARAEHAKRRKQHRKIAEHVVARANPRRAHVASVVSRDGPARFGSDVRFGSLADIESGSGMSALSRSRHAQRRNQCLLSATSGHWFEAVARLTALVDSARQSNEFEARGTRSDLTLDGPTPSWRRAGDEVKEAMTRDQSTFLMR